MPTKTWFKKQDVAAAYRKLASDIENSDVTSEDSQNVNGNFMYYFLEPEERYIEVLLYAVDGCEVLQRSQYVMAFVPVTFDKHESAIANFD